MSCALPVTVPTRVLLLASPARAKQEVDRIAGLSDVAGHPSSLQADYKALRAWIARTGR